MTATHARNKNLPFNVVHLVHKVSKEMKQELEQLDELFIVLENSLIGLTGQMMN